MTKWNGVGKHNKFIGLKNFKELLTSDTNALKALVFTLEYWGLSAPLAVFMFHGFVKSLPLELEESGAIDGASPYGIFVRIVFPVMVPVISTVIILNVMWIWNDFLLPLLMLNGEQSTLQLASYKFFGQYKSEWQYALTAVVYTSIPPIAVFLFLQKYIIKGMVAGAVKG